MNSDRPIRFPSSSQRLAQASGIIAALAFSALLMACGKPGDPGGGTSRERSMASPASTPATGLPEPTPGIAPSAAAAASANGR